MQIKLEIRLLPYLELAPHSFKLQRKETLINKNKLIGFLICIRVEVNVKVIIFSDKFDNKNMDDCLFDLHFVILQNKIKSSLNIKKVKDLNTNACK